ncbi:hypothetical protein AMTRI_Chr05g70020 [Amborella trichopoda]
MKLVDTLRRRRVNIVCLQETKWKGEKAKEIDGGYTKKDNNGNGVDIIVEKYLKDKIDNVKRICDRLLFIKFILGDEIINVISAYAPQVGLEDRIKRILEGYGEMAFFKGDLNGHVGKDMERWPFSEGT